MTLRSRSQLGTTVWALAAFTFSVLLATPALAEEEEMVSNLSGSVSFDFNTNFMSYGLDVWGTGNFGDALFQPSTSLEWALPGGVALYSGLWFDINNDAPTNIGRSGDFAIQEVDWWVGAAYSWEKLSMSATYQSWMYGGDVERIFDVGLAYDTFLSPSVTLHSRINQTKGLVAVLGLEEGFDAGPVSVAFPVAVALLTSDYYVAGQSGGFGYVSVGVNAGVPLSFIPTSYGEWGFGVGGTYYYTDPDHIGNPDDNIFTMNTNISLAF